MLHWAQVTMYKALALLVTKLGWTTNSGDGSLLMNKKRKV